MTDQVNKRRQHNEVLLKTIILATVLLGSLLFALDGIFYHWLCDLSGFGRGAKVGLSLLVFWLVVPASLRSINRLAGGIDILLLCTIKLQEL